MQRGIYTPQDKLIGVNNKFGNIGIEKQQGTTVVKYDTLPLDGRTEFRFFEGSSQRNFPLSNTGSDGDRLGVGNAMVVQRAYLAVVTTGTGGITTAVEEVSIATFPFISSGEFAFSIAGQVVIKGVPIMSWLPEFNKDAVSIINSSFEFDTMVSIPPLLEYVATIKIAGQPAVANKQLRLTIEGVGSLIAPRTTF